MRVPLYRAGSMVCLCVLVSGCDPAPEGERTYYEEQEVRAEDERFLMEVMTTTDSMDGAIQLVQQQEAPDEFGGTIEEWLAVARREIEGDVMFPRWEGQRKGANRFEVRYTHTVIDYDYNIMRTGYTWEVDTMMKVVNGPKPIDPEELKPKTRTLPSLDSMLEDGDDDDDALNLE